MIIRLLPLFAIVNTALALLQTDDVPSYGEFSNSSIYNLTANGDFMVPDRSYYVQELANATGEAKKEAALLAKTRKNDRTAAAATHPPGDTMMVCFGVTGNPTRIQLFKDAVQKTKS